ncbi:MAG: hypothetical protein U5K79_14640 [Cyclobacteriaceae bacterium]|nr:hypothetical protein [Cyclobacteriaceae bacterium]
MKKEETIDYYIKTSWHSLSRLYNQKAVQHDITTSIAFILLNISTSEGTPATKIAPQMGLESRKPHQNTSLPGRKGFYIQREG